MLCPTLRSRKFSKFYSSVCLCTRLLDIGNQVSAVLLLLQPCEHHLGARDVLLGVGQVHIQGVLVPGDALTDVSLGVGETTGPSGLPPPDSIKVRSLLVLAPSLHGVALRTGFCKDLLPVGRAHFISCRSESSNIS